MLGIWRGGGGQQIWVPHLNFKGMKFRTLVYMWFPISTELWAYFSSFVIHWFMSLFLKSLFLGGWQNIGGGQLPPCPSPPPCSYGHYGYYAVNTLTRKHPFIESISDYKIVIYISHTHAHTFTHNIRTYAHYSCLKRLILIFKKLP